MADILIRGMEMPKEGEMIFIAADGSVWINAGPTRGYMRMENVCAVPLPEGHGRLGDLDALMKNIGDVPYKGSVKRVLMSAPTIIEADLEWKMNNCCCFSNTDQAEGGGEDG